MGALRRCVALEKTPITTTHKFVPFIRSPFGNETGRSILLRQNMLMTTLRVLQQHTLTRVENPKTNTPGKRRGAQLQPDGKREFADDIIQTFRECSIHSSTPSTLRSFAKNAHLYEGRLGCTKGLHAAHPPKVFHRMPSVKEQRIQPRKRFRWLVIWKHISFLFRGCETLASCD